MQKMLMIETTRLHGELNEAFRIHDGMLQNEAAMRRTLEQHFELMRNIVGNLQSQLANITQQLSIEREAARQNAKLMQAFEAEQKTMSQKLHDQISIMNETIATASQAATSRIDLSISNLEQRLQQNISKAVLDEASARSQISDELARRSMQTSHDVEQVQSHIVQLDSQVKEIASRSESTTTRFTAALQECVSFARQADEDQKGQMTNEITGRMQQIVEHLTNQDQTMLKTAEERFIQVTKQLANVQTHVDDLETKRMMKLDEDIAAVQTMVQTELQKADCVRKAETDALLHVVVALKASVTSLRERENRLAQSLSDTKAGILQELQALRENLATELRKNGRALIVL
eukprot:jgi/Hompol1/6334/HPOL_001502-RA